MYGNLTSQTSWAFFDTTMVNPGASGYFGGAFDGRYVYFSPVGQARGVALEYDTRAAFTVTKSWTTFALEDDAGDDDKFVGAAFDGRYLYLPPFAQASPVLSRYDTQGTYSSAASWTSVALASVTTSSPKGTAGAVYASHHVYFPPYANGVALAYDTTAPMTSASAWSSHDASLLVGSSFVACSGASDGKYVYFAPYSSGLMLRYDMSMAFTATGAWATFDTTALNASAGGFEGAVFDGRYVYFVPAGAQFTATLTVRYDTTMPLASTGAWETFDIKGASAAAGGFVGGAFDGRYVYYVPYGSSTGMSGLVVRFDTTQPSFSAVSAWQTFDLTTLNPTARGYAGAAFDGRYVYLVPNLSGGVHAHLVARFDARTPPAIPPSDVGSYF